MIMKIRTMIVLFVLSLVLLVVGFLAGNPVTCFRAAFSIVALFTQMTRERR